MDIGVFLGLGLVGALVVVGGVGLVADNLEEVGIGLLCEGVGVQYSIGRIF